MEENELNIVQMREKFEEKVKSKELSINCSLISSEEAYENLIAEVEEAKIRSKKTYTDYRRLKRYDVLTVGKRKKLIRPLSENERDIKFFVHIDQLFDIIHASHLATGHGGKHKLENDIKTKYVNVTREVIQIYLELCLLCKKKKNQNKKSVVMKPLTFTDINECAQVDLIDMQTSRDREYKFILNYQEHLTKFVFFRPLKSMNAAEIACNLIDIFCMIGAPAILQSGHGRDFCNNVIMEVKKMWPDLQIVQGKPSHSQNQERANHDVQDMLVAWMQENNSTEWSEGLRFCQWRKNNSLHSVIQQTPYEAMFGRKSHMGLHGTSNLPSSVLSIVMKKEELEY